MQPKGFVVITAKLIMSPKNRVTQWVILDDILTYLNGAKYFTSLDLFSGYWQIGLEEDSKEYTAFIAPGYGLYEFNVLSFGLPRDKCSIQIFDVKRRSGRIKWKEVQSAFKDRCNH